MARFNQDSTHFRQFVSGLEAVMCGYGDTGEEDRVRQKRQVETLVDLEKQFRNALIRDHRGPAIYKAFVRLIRDEHRNILAARPFFRERQNVFTAKIATALRDRKDKTLYQFAINYRFIAFALKTKKFQPGAKVTKLARQVEAIRKEIIELNIPMAISRARVFGAYRQAHLEHMDLVQIGNEGLIAAVDKFVPPYSKVFGAVLFGRITGDLVEGNSETLIHFYPSDKRKIYTANKLAAKGKTFDEISEHINAEAQKQITNPNELQQLHVAAYTVSGDSSGPGDGHDPDVGVDDTAISRFAASEESRPDIQYEKAELHHKLHQNLNTLSLFERKLLQLKGINL